MFRLIATGALVFLIAQASAESQEPAKKAKVPMGFVASKSPPNWIWLGNKAKAKQTAFFRKTFEIKGGMSNARLFATGDDDITVYLDGQEVLTNNNWESPAHKDVTSSFITQTNLNGNGKHVLAVRARNKASAAGILLRLEFESAYAEGYALISDSSWKAAEKAPQTWANLDFDDSTWKPVTVLGQLGEKPWTTVTETTLASAAKLKEPEATPADQLKVLKDFKVELLYSVPKEKQGSWVNLCVDPKGRLITSDQYGSLYRVTPPPLGGKADSIRIEKIPVDIGESQGLLWAFDSLYVVVNRGQKYEPGLYRVRDTNGDDQLDEVKMLHKLTGGGEHGPHAVLLSPDGKSLTIVCGNGTKLTDITGSRVPRVWGEDHLLPRMPDGRGFMRDVMAPGGCIYKVDPEGKNWELLSSGYRNQYDAAYNRFGDLFTYDADMEWDMNTPWYRPTRVCLATSGSEFGWRNGAGKWPSYYPDSLPSILDIGPGSPTGVAFGYGAKFPAKYQEALFICDWSYGKLYAIHLTPEGSAYKAEPEEFVTGTPLPLTDLIVNPKDGCLYFTIGGRKTTSGLYRVSYIGKESTAPLKQDERNYLLHELRQKLETYHGKADPGAIGEVWPHLGHSDRIIRFAARVALEHQDPKLWSTRALEEKNPASALTALLALARVGDKTHQTKLLEALDRLNWSSLTESQKIDLLRVYGLAFIRMGKPDDATRLRTIARFDSHFPASGRFLNAELAQMLVYLQAPTAAAKILKLLEDAPTQEEQIDYARALRVLQAGWTADARKQYFQWFIDAGRFKGGASFELFLKNIKDDAIASLTSEEKTALKPLIETPPRTTGPTFVAQPRPFVKKWSVEELTSLVGKGLKNRDFDRGRILFGQASCFACHRFANEGGAMGPDLTMAAGRFSARDLLESIIDPSKVISDQYGAVVVTTDDGRVVTGRIINLAGDSIMINTNMLDPNSITRVDRKRVEMIEPSKISMMPAGLLDTFKEEEILDLMAYLLSRGDRNHAMFQRP